MTPRERFRTALSRGYPDRVPIELKFTRPVMERFRAETGQEDFREYFNLDFREVAIRRPQKLQDFAPYFRDFCPEIDSFDRNAPFRLWPGTVYNQNIFNYMITDRISINEWGELRTYSEEDPEYHEKTAAFGAREQVSLEEIEAFPLPDMTDPARYQGVTEEIGQLHRRGLAAVSFLEMTIFEKAWRIRGFDRLLMDFLLCPEVAQRLLERVAECTGTIAESVAKCGVDLIKLGDDVSTQEAMMFSPDVWRRLLKPLYRKIVARIKAANPDTLIYYHGDGNITDLIPDLIDIGVEVLNPIQPECMNSVEAKKVWGEHLAFWGGIGTQSTMPFDKPDQVRQEVRRQIEVLGEKGGYLCAPTHVLEQDVPWENILAFVDSVKLYGVY